MKRELLILTCLGLSLAAGCSGRGPEYCQGYVEGEFVYIAPPSGGRLVNLAVARGDRVAAGQVLYRLEPEPQSYSSASAQAVLRQYRSLLADKEKGERPPRIESLEGALGQAEAQAEMSRLEAERLRPIHESKFVSDNDYDRAVLDYRARSEAVRQARGNLEEAQLGGREDQVAAAAAQVEAAEAALLQACWELEQRIGRAPAAGLVFDTLYREGERVAPGGPVAILLPPENIKIRFFVPQPQLPRLEMGGLVRFRVQGSDRLAEARVDYISPEAEYTPPVIFSRDNSSKLIYLVEARPVSDPSALHPGQPVEVYLAPGGRER